MIVKLSAVALCWSLVPALSLPQAAAAHAETAAIPPAAVASAQPSTVQTKSDVTSDTKKPSDATNLSAKAPHLISSGRKSWHGFAYMKQANDDRDGLSRIQDQARQLSPPR